MVYVGIDVGGTGLKAGIVDENGKLLNKCTCPTGVERGHEAVINDMANLALQAIAEGGFTVDDVKAIGIGIPGILDPKTNRVPFCTNLGWHDVPLVELRQKVIDKPIFVNNDATVAGFAEAVAGVSAGVKDSVFVTLGTGVGGGIFIDGKPYSGAHGVGSEIGHIIIVDGGEMCTCGTAGCWERYASATAIIRMGKKAASENPECAIATAVNGDLDQITARTVIDAAKAGDYLANQALDKVYQYMGQFLSMICCTVDPEVVVLGGGVSKAGQTLIDGAKRYFDEYIFHASRSIRFALASLGNDAGAYGAFKLALNAAKQA